MPAQKLTWEQNIRRKLNAFIHSHHTGVITSEKKEEFIAKIKATAKPEFEKAFDAGQEYLRALEFGVCIHDFETWYQNTYLK